MKILYHHRIASKDGQYVHIEELTRSLAKRGHELVFVEPGSMKSNSFGKSSSTVSGIRDKLPGAVHELLELSYAFFDFLKLVHKIIQVRPDCIYERYNLFLPSGIWAKKLFGLPLILEVNAPLYDERKKYMGITLNKLARWTETYAWKNADRVLPVTNVLAGYLRQSGVPEGNIVVIPNGIDADKFNNRGKSSRLEADLKLKGKTVLGFVGFLRQWHDLEKVIELMSENAKDDWHFLVIGDGPARAQLEQRASMLGVSDHLTITGVVARDEMPEFISLFDIALQPNVVDYASPLKLFEYMAAGKAILAVDRENIREVIQNDRDALLFSAEDAADFSEKLERLYHSPELRQRLGKAAIERIESGKYFWDENARRVEGLLCELQ